MTEKSYATSIKLPAENFFRNLKSARRFAIDIVVSVWYKSVVSSQGILYDTFQLSDGTYISRGPFVTTSELHTIKWALLHIVIGGSLAKLAYSSTIQRKTSLVLEDQNEEDGSIYQVSDQDESITRLNFIKFETKFVESCLDFIKHHLHDIQQRTVEKSVKVTGGGAYKYTELITSKLGVSVDKEDEICCLIKGCNFLLKNIPDEVFMYQRHGTPEYKFQGTDHDIFPYLLVNIGSGVSLVKVESERKFSRIGGTSSGGGTFWGLGSLLTKAKTFDELLKLAETGDHRKVDMLVKDIYGGSYSTIGLPGDVIASSFGKAAWSPRDMTEERSFKEADIARSLLLSISNDIGQIACLHAKIHGLKKVYFGGYFIRGHPLTMHTITYAINFWSKGEIQSLFLRHEGYLGAIGAFLKGAEEEDSDPYSGEEGLLRDAEKYSWEENFAGSSGLSDNKMPGPLPGPGDSKFDMLELDRLEKTLEPCPLLIDVGSYFPDTVDLTQDESARDYWLQCFVESIEKQEEQAIKSQETFTDTRNRASSFKNKYLQMLKILKQNPCAYGSLNVRGLLDMRSHCLQEFNFTDPYSQQKQFENEQALRYLSDRLRYIDSLDDNSRLLELAQGFLAGNVFDWGAKEVAAIMEKGEFSFKEAQSKLQERPWLMDDFDKWTSRRNGSNIPYKCAAIFCDNSGPDIILGVFPFARDLIKSGSKVILCANSRPALNDVTYKELTIVVKRVCQICPVISQAYTEGRLAVMESGQGSPCLDLRYIDSDLVAKIKSEKADLIVIEGMGRAIHTNLEAQFKCDSLKLAVLKNRWLAKRFGGEMFSVVFKFETGGTSLKNDTAIR